MTTEVAELEQVEDAEAEETRVEKLKREHYEEILECQQVVSQACMNWLDAKGTAAARKKTYEGALEELQAVIRRNPLQPKLFDDSDTVDTGSQWREMCISTLIGDDVTEKQVEKLENHGIHTLGQLQQLMEKEGTFWSKEIKGIGEKAATAIEDALNAIVVATETGTEAGDDYEES